MPRYLLLLLAGINPLGDFLGGYDKAVRIKTGLRWPWGRCMSRSKLFPDVRGHKIAVFRAIARFTLFAVGNAIFHCCQPMRLKIFWDSVIYSLRS